tara:strand:+ start:2119 stop:2427 length:309 start_codon:yes stop_codon:yes gene_type:complete
MTDNNTSAENTKANEWKEREIGALWKKAGKSQNYFSGKINVSSFNEGSINIVGFANSGKSKNPNSPDVILYASEQSNALDLNSSNTASSTSDESVEDESPEI